MRRAGEKEIHALRARLSDQSIELNKALPFTWRLVVSDEIARVGIETEDRADAVVLRDPAQDGELTTVLKKDIDERNDKGPSLMPEGLVNVYSGRQEFLDLLPTSAP